MRGHIILDIGMPDTAQDMWSQYEYKTQWTQLSVALSDLSEKYGKAKTILNVSKSFGEVPMIMEDGTERLDYYGVIIGHWRDHDSTYLSMENGDIIKVTLLAVEWAP